MEGASSPCPSLALGTQALRRPRTARPLSPPPAPRPSPRPPHCPAVCAARSPVGPPSAASLPCLCAYAPACPCVWNRLLPAGRGGENSGPDLADLLLRLRIPASCLNCECDATHIVQFRPTADLSPTSLPQAPRLPPAPKRPPALRPSLRPPHCPLVWPCAMRAHHGKWPACNKHFSFLRFFQKPSF